MGFTGNVQVGRHKRNVTNGSLMVFLMILFFGIVLGIYAGIAYALQQVYNHFRPDSPINYWIALCIVVVTSFVLGLLQRK